MPSAANVKIDKQINSDTALADSSTSATPMRQAITVIEHKIRNLEKRKAKLESYRDLQSSGKELNHDQKTAVAKYEEVVQTLEFARDLCKQFLGIAAVSEKDAKKQARKEAVAKSQAELAKIREVLLVQDALNQMGHENVRDDFLLNRNGAVSLSETDLKLLDDLYPAVTPKHELGNPTAFTNQVQAAAEHLLAVVDGKQKDVFGGSYSQIKEVIGKIHESGYLDQPSSDEFEEAVVIVEPEEQNCNIVPELIQPVPEVLQTLEQPIIEAPIPLVVPQQIEAPLEQIPVEPQPIYFQQPPPRPITEVLGTPSFFFLQDSELDTPDTLPTQTFTNTSYVQGPPPPIPLPPNFQTYQPPPGNQIVSPTNGNGIEEVVVQPPLQQPPKTEEPQKHRVQQQPRPNNNQTFYQNNNNHNNYNNRPRQHRNGPRAGNNRQQQQQ